MKPITDKEVLTLFKHKSCLSSQEKKISKKISELDKELNDCRVKLDIVNKVSFFYKGIAIRQVENYFSGIVTPKGCFGPRHGKIYLNAHNKTTWGAIIHLERYPNSFNNDIWLGAGWPDKETVKRLVLDFIVSGKIPSHRMFA